MEAGKESHNAKKRDVLLSLLDVASAVVSLNFTQIGIMHADLQADFGCGGERLTVIVVLVSFLFLSVQTLKPPVAATANRLPLSVRLLR